MTCKPNSHDFKARYKNAIVPMFVAHERGLIQQTEVTINQIQPLPNPYIGDVCSKCGQTRKKKL